MTNNPKRSDGISPARREGTDAGEKETADHQNYILQRMTLRASFSLAVVLFLTYALTLVGTAFLSIFTYDCITAAVLLVLMNSAGAFVDRVLLTVCLITYCRGVRAGVLIEDDAA